MYICRQEASVQAINGRKGRGRKETKSHGGKREERHMQARIKGQGGSDRKVIKDVMHE